MNRSKFYNENDFNVDIKMSKDFIQDDMGIVIYLFSLNIVVSKKDIYGESLPTEKDFLDPVELPAFIAIDNSTHRQLSSDMLVNEEIENINIGIYIDDIESKNIDPKRGDFILYNDNTTKRFFEIDTITNITTNNQMYNYKAFYKQIKANYVRDYKLPPNLKTLII
jgi:hypothetical protein